MEPGNKARIWSGEWSLGTRLGFGLEAPPHQIPHMKRVINMQETTVAMAAKEVILTE